MYQKSIQKAKSFCKHNPNDQKEKLGKQAGQERERDLLEKTFWTKDKGSTFPFSFKCLDK